MEKKKKKEEALILYTFSGNVVAAESNLQVPPKRIVAHLLADKITNVLAHIFHKFGAGSDTVRVKESVLIDYLSFACGFGNTLQSILCCSETSGALQ